MGHHRSYSESIDSRVNNEQREKLVGLIRRNRKKILLALLGVVLIVVTIGILILYFIFTFLLKGKDIVVNPNAINQAQKIATETGKLIPQNLPQIEWLQNFSWIINLINLFQSFGG